MKIPEKLSLTTLPRTAWIVMLPERLASEHREEECDSFNAKS